MCHKFTYQGVYLMLKIFRFVFWFFFLPPKLSAAPSLTEKACEMLHGFIILKVPASTVLVANNPQYHLDHCLSHWKNKVWAYFISTTRNQWAYHFGLYHLFLLLWIWFCFSDYFTKVSLLLQLVSKFKFYKRN